MVDGPYTTAKVGNPVRMPPSPGSLMVRCLAANSLWPSLLPPPLLPSAACPRSKSAHLQSSGPHRKFHHWYLNGALKITPEDEKELGPPMTYITTESTGNPGAPKNTRRNSRQSSDDRAPQSGVHVVVQVVGDPGVGAEATARGGGWMGAANGRL